MWWALKTPWTGKLNVHFNLNVPFSEGGRPLQSRENNGSWPQPLHPTPLTATEMVPVLFAVVEPEARDSPQPWSWSLVLGKTQPPVDACIQDPRSGLLLSNYRVFISNLKNTQSRDKEIDRNVVNFCLPVLNRSTKVSINQSIKFSHGLRRWPFCCNFANETLMRHSSILK